MTDAEVASPSHTSAFAPAATLSFAEAAAAPSRLTRRDAGLPRDTASADGDIAGCAGSASCLVSLQLGRKEKRRLHGSQYSVSRTGVDPGAVLGALDLLMSLLDLKASKPKRMLLFLASFQSSKVFHTPPVRTGLEQHPTALHVEPSKRKERCQR